MYPLYRCIIALQNKGFGSIVLALLQKRLTWYKQLIFKYSFVTNCKWAIALLLIHFNCLAASIFVTVHEER